MFNEIKSLISNGELKKAILELRVQLKEGNKWENELINYSYRFSELKKMENLDTLSFEEINKKKNRIVKSLLELIDLIKSNGQYSINKIAESDVNKTEKVEISPEKKEFKVESAISSFEKARKALESADDKYEENIIKYKYVFYTTKEMNSTFTNGFSGYGTFLNWIGYQFFWRKKPNELLKFYGTSISNSWNGKYAHICSIDVPEVWNGFGIWELTGPSKSEKDDLLIALFLTNIDYNMDFKDYHEEQLGYFIGAFYLDEMQTEFFHKLSEKNFEDIK